MKPGQFTYHVPRTVEEAVALLGEQAGSDDRIIVGGQSLLLTMSVVPGLEILLTEDAPSPLNPLGIKGSGESVITAVRAVIAAAIDDTLAAPGAVRQLPVTPQRLRALLKAGSASPA